MITTTDIDVVSYCKEIINCKVVMNEGVNSHGKISFDVDLTEKELDEYYMSDYRRFKRGMDDTKKMISSRKKSNNIN